MNDKLEVEARLERSLRRQLSAPKLDGRFDAAVWSRIAAEEEAAAKKNAAPWRTVPRRAPRWLVASNFVGIGVAVVLLAWSAVRSISGIEMPAELVVEMPRLSAEQRQSMLEISGIIIAAAALVFGLMFTRLGRRLISEFR